ncbi:MAG: GNAT family N-acetyltransferase, partial [Clostridia bacterium]|nr:GNAT family N-acetyltransferase [Clostridia bacterium]
VATDKDFRNRGFAGELIEYAKQFVRKKNEKFLVILPQNDGLFDFYKKFGFSELKCAAKIDEIISYTKDSRFFIEKTDSAEYFMLREAYFEGKKYVKWDKDMLDYFIKVYDGEYIKISEKGRTVASAFCYEAEDKLIISELLTKEDVLSSIGEFFYKKHILGFKEEALGKRFAMIYPESYVGSYFGIGMN